MSGKKMRFRPNEEGYKSRRFEIRLDENTFNKLERLASKKGLTKAEYIRYLIEKTK